jgi:hypothetical protein
MLVLTQLVCGSPYASAALNPQEDSWYSYLLEADPRVIMRLEGLGQSEKSIDLIEYRTRDLPACIIVPPQPTTLQRGPKLLF